MHTISPPGVNKFIIPSVRDDFKQSLRTATQNVPSGHLLGSPFPIPTMKGTWYLKRGYTVEELKPTDVFIHGTGSFDCDNEEENEAIITIEVGNPNQAGTIRITSR